MAAKPLTRAAPVAAAALCAALALAGCSGQRDTHEGRKVEAVVKQFALSRGPETCAMFTTRALVSVYGGREVTPRAARVHCLARSRRFQGERVDVTFVKLNTPTTAHASARSLDRRQFWTVGLLKFHGRWLIDSVARQQKPA